MTTTPTTVTDLDPAALDKLQALADTGQPVGLSHETFAALVALARRSTQAASLTDERIKEIVVETCLSPERMGNAIDFARSIEREVRNQSAAGTGADERAMFEAKFPMPPRVERTADGYAITYMDAFAQKYVYQWQGWQARATIANTGAGATVAVPRAVLERCLSAMKQAVSFGETGRGRPPSQTCMFEIEELEATLAAPASPTAGATGAGEPIYQVQYIGEYASSIWHDATEAAYQTFMPERRRIVYAATASPATQPATSIGEDVKFQDLATYWHNERYGTRRFDNAWSELIAHIDARLRGAAPSAQPVAYLHQVVCGDGEPDQALSFAPDNFPLSGTLGYRSISHRPLVFGDIAPAAEGEAGRDTARLEWLEATQFDVLYPGAPYATWQAIGGRMGESRGDGNLSFRAAIDAAMSQAGSAAGEGGRKA